MLRQTRQVTKRALGELSGSDRTPHWWRVRSCLRRVSSVAWQHGRAREQTRWRSVSSTVAASDLDLCAGAGDFDRWDRTEALERGGHVDDIQRLVAPRKLLIESQRLYFEGTSI
jgi:hypothetical protein